VSGLAEWRDSVRLLDYIDLGINYVYIPNSENEAFRDLVRCREDAKEDELSAKNRLSKFLLRNDITPPVGVRKWAAKYYKWLDALKYENSKLQVSPLSNSCILVVLSFNKTKT
jgi:transposase